MILRDKTSPLSHSASIAECSSSLSLSSSSFRLIQNGTSCWNLKLNGCLYNKFKQQASIIEQQQLKQQLLEHAISITTNEGGVTCDCCASWSHHHHHLDKRRSRGRSRSRLPALNEAWNEYEQANNNNVANNQQVSPTDELVFKKNEQTTKTGVEEIYSRRTKRQRKGKQRQQQQQHGNTIIQFALPIPLYCLLAVALISLHVPLETTCKSIETSQSPTTLSSLSSTSNETEILLHRNNNLLNDNKNKNENNNDNNNENNNSNQINHLKNNQTISENLQLKVQKSSTPLAEKIISIFSSVYTQATTPIPSSTEPPKATYTGTETISEVSTTGEKEEEKVGEEETESEDNGSSTGRDDDDAEGCKGISADGPTKTANLTDNERLVNLQSCFQRKIRRQLMSATRGGMEMFEKLSLSGGCSSSLMSLMGGLGQLKSYAFKFLDASAKIPSGMMYGLLSDYGDFDQCMSIRSNKEVSLENEAEEGAFSGKYCLMSLKLNYHLKLNENSTVPDGIIEDGILWDELVRHYWTSKVSKGFQVGMCFPSRCTNDDLQQLYQHVAKSFNIIGEIISCQDSLDLKRQYQPDLLQKIILCMFHAIVGLTIIGTFVDRWCSQQVSSMINISISSDINGCKERIVQLLLCFSISRNWIRFMNGYESHNLQQQQQQQRQQRQQRERQIYSQYDKLNCLPANLFNLSLMESKTNNNNEDNITTPTSSTAKSITEQTSINVTNNRFSATTASSSDNVDFIDSDESSSSSNDSETTASIARPSGAIPIYNKPLTVCIDPTDIYRPTTWTKIDCNNKNIATATTTIINYDPLAHLSGMKLLIIIWITVGYSFLYPSANNYQYYRSIIKMNLTRDSVWFATTNFLLGIDMLLYITGLLFVYKLLAPQSIVEQQSTTTTTTTKQQPINNMISRVCTRHTDHEHGIVSLISRKALRFWPTYLTLIAIAIIVPLISDGPMWPEMVTKKLGESCRNNWWANLLFINNYLNQSDICLPSSWFISILMQLFFIGSFIVVLIHKVSLEAGWTVLATLLISSSVFSFGFSYLLKVGAPVIRMDESFVMDLDENIFRLYTNVFNNLGPFLVGMAGGLLLIRHQHIKRTTISSSSNSSRRKEAATGSSSTCSKWLIEITGALVVSLIAILVLSSVFHEHYSPLTSSLYWSLHRIGWAIVTGYIIHNCATGRWRLINDLLSLSAFAPLSRLIFIAYLVYPIFIHIHTGLVRDGLHISIYNMLNIYITRLVMTFTTALIIHLLIELPFSSIEETYLRKLISNNRSKKEDNIKKTIAQSSGSSLEAEITHQVDPLITRLVHPLLAVAKKHDADNDDESHNTIDIKRTIVMDEIGTNDRDKTFGLQANNSSDKLIEGKKI